MARTANSARQAGVDMNSLIGYLAAVGEVTQRDMSTVGEAFKTIFARYGNVKLGKLIDDESGESLNDFETALNAVGVALRDETGSFRNFNDVMLEIRENYQRFSDIEISALATTLGGVRQRENVIVLFENMAKAMEYAGIAANSSGTAMSKFAAYQESIEAKSQKMAAAFENLSMSLLSEDLIGFFYDFGTEIFNTAAKIPSFVKQGAVLTATLTGVASLFQGFKATTFGKAFLSVSKDLGWLETTSDRYYNIVPSYRENAA